MDKRYTTALIIMFAMFIGAMAIPALGRQNNLNSLSPPGDYIAAHAAPHIDTSDDVIILKDTDAWRFPANEQILNELDIDYSVAGSPDFGRIDLNDFKFVIVASDQPQAFYNALDAHLSEFDAFVRDGGLLQFNGADKGWETGFWKELPGGVTHKKLYDSENHVINEDHPFVKDVPSAFTGDYASHGHFLNIPGQTTMITRDTAGVQTMIEYGLGSGKIIASGVALEAAYGWGWDGHQILVNIIKYALELKGIVPRQPPMIRVVPKTMEPVTLKQNENTTQVLRIYNDGDMDLTFDLEIQNADALDIAIARNEQGVMPVGVKGSDVRPDVYEANAADFHIDASHDVLILKDVNAWKTKSNEIILHELGVLFSVASSATLGSINLNDYKLIIVASDQPQLFYNAFDAHLSEFENYVRAGGILQFNGADMGWETGFWSRLPGVSPMRSCMTAKMK